MSSNSVVKEWAKSTREDIYVKASARDSIREILTDDDIESLPRRIYEAILDMYLYSHSREDTESFAHEMREEFEASVFFHDEDSGELDYLGEDTPLGRRIYSMIFKFVLYEQDVVSFKQRCRDDSSFLARRIVDVLMAFNAIRALEVGLLVNGSRTTVPHQALEVGRPAQRIAMTVLGEFASLLANDPLPPSFWHSTWPSLVPIVESAGAAKSPAQEGAVERMTDFNFSKSLRYPKDYGIIQSAKVATTEGV